ncbi:response regulator transcription factor [Paraburkholderia rhizosphaerae]|uniref:Winged helix family two component transcriptional regulator n=1 Tax=Paraburkholderia rhizosphaerae TaxID=480658 RepID=A0A4V3HCK9_9BURK|nr:response regulator transcription factor [Paraburkholderia rhizosphaerae]TDY37464.1 winged helix family two component transcriptional regulator [Paraburkholderia rhizosphaerae]
MARILTIEDDEWIVDDIVRALSATGLAVDVARTGREGLVKAMSDAYDVITVDRVLPDLDGLKIVSTMRGAGIDTPVLVMSALDGVEQRIEGLRAGSDDYLIKPFSADEMSARVEVLLRRRPRSEPEPVVLRVGPLELDRMRRRITARERIISLQPTEFRLLEFMMRHAGQVMTRTMIFEGVWGGRFDPGTNLIDVHIGRLRKKLEADGDPPLIRTVRGSGYLLG